MILDQSLEKSNTWNRWFVLAKILSKRFKERVFLGHIPVSHHIAEFSDAIINQIFLYIIRVANNFPEEVTSLELEVIISGVSAEFTEALEFFNG